MNGVKDAQRQFVIQGFNISASNAQNIRKVKDTRNERWFAFILMSASITRHASSKRRNYCANI